MMDLGIKTVSVWNKTNGRKLIGSNSKAKYNLCLIKFILF